MSIRLASLLTSLLIVLVAGTAAAQGRVSIEELTVDGDPPPDMYRAVLIEGIRPSVEEIGTAYGRRLAERPGLAGDYRMRLWVSNREVIRITPETSIGDETMERLTREAIYRFRLPDAAPAGGAWVRFIVRFTPPTSGVGAAGTAPVSPSTGSSGSTGSTVVTRVRPHCSLAAAATACQCACFLAARSPPRRSTDRSQTSGWMRKAPSSPAFSTTVSMRSLAGMPSASVTSMPNSR